MEHIDQHHGCLLYTSILLDECGFDWDKAFEICQKVFAYTNHTVMAEALEKWNCLLYTSTNSMIGIETLLF